MSDYVVDEVNGNSATTGSGLVDTVASAGAALERGDWLEGGLLSLCALGEEASLLAEPNPFQALLSAGIGWLMERIRPVHEWLDQFAGNPDAVLAYAQTWQNVSSGLESVAGQFEAHAGTAAVDWHGVAGAAYALHAATGGATIRACSTGTSGVASAVLLASSLVTGVRAMIRGLISDIVAFLLTRSAILLSGIGTAPVLAELGVRVAQAAQEIGGTARRVVRSCDALVDDIRTVSNGLEAASTALRQVGRAGGAVVAPATSAQTVFAGAVRDTLSYDDL